LYAYCLNNPISYVDPTGHSTIVIGLIIGAFVGAAIGFGTATYIDYTLKKLIKLLEESLKNGEIKMKRKRGEGEEYIDAFPKFKKWINECVCCHDKGYDPTMPEKISANEVSLGAYFIKKYFKPLSINEDGLCAQCEKLLNNK